jgi:hypothetical protein
MLWAEPKRHLGGQKGKDWCDSFAFNKTEESSAAEIITLAARDKG